MQDFKHQQYQQTLRVLSNIPDRAMGIMSWDCLGVGLGEMVTPESVPAPDKKQGLLSHIRILQHGHATGPTLWFRLSFWSVHKFNSHIFKSNQQVCSMIEPGLCSTCFKVPASRHPYHTGSSRKTMLRHIHINYFGASVDSVSGIEISGQWIWIYLDHQVAQNDRAPYPEKSK